MTETTTRPRADIRRFDVFAEYNRIEKQQEGLPEDEAKGYGIWIAKYVAAKKFSRGTAGPKTPHETPKEQAPKTEQKWRSLGGQVQTDETFDDEIVDRMGREFYESVFSPAIQRAVEEHRDYKEIRDSIRKEWKSL